LKEGKKATRVSKGSCGAGGGKEQRDTGREKEEGTQDSEGSSFHRRLEMQEVSFKEGRFWLD